MPAKINLYDELFDPVIKDLGHWAMWERAAVCSCVNRSTGQPDFTCPICGGSGYRYLPAKKIKVAITSIMSSVELKSLELREPGTAYATPTSDIIMGYMDKLTFPEFKCAFSEVMHWSVEDGRGISPETKREIKEVLSLADDKYEYEPGIDFEISEDGYHLRWINQEYIEKLDGKDMSILYMTSPQYIVTDLLHELRATLSDRKTPETTFRELPKQYKIQRIEFNYNINKPEPVAETDKPEVEEKYTSDGIEI